MSAADVIALILHFRTAEQTLACLRSLHEEGVQLAVMVDNSQDDGRSLSEMRASLDRLREEGMRVDILTPLRNLGFAAGVNSGLAHIRDKHPGHVLLINSDARLMHGALKAMHACLETGRHIVAPAVAANDAAPGHPLVVYYQKYLALYLRKSHPGTISYPSGCCLLLGRDLLDAPLFDADFFFYGEDVMLGERLRAAGAWITPCPKALVIHAGSFSSRNGSLFYEYHMVRAHWLLASKLGQHRMQRWAGLAGRFLTLPARALLRSLRMRSLRPVHAFWLASSDLLRGRFRDLTPPAG